MVSTFQRRKDVVQVATESAASRLGRIAVILTDAVRDVAREVGDFLTDMAEMSEAARAAREDALEREGTPEEPPAPGS